MLLDVSYLRMQAAEQEAAQSKAKLGAWGVLDSFRVNHNHTEVAEFTHAATAKAVRMELAFLRQEEMQINLVRDILPTPFSSVVPTAHCM